MFLALVFIFLAAGSVEHMAHAPGPAWSQDMQRDWH